MPASYLPERMSARAVAKALSACGAMTRPVPGRGGADGFGGVDASRRGSGRGSRHGRNRPLVRFAPGLRLLDEEPKRSRARQGPPVGSALQWPPTPRARFPWHCPITGETAIGAAVEVLRAPAGGVRVDRRAKRKHATAIEIPKAAKSRNSHRTLPRTNAHGSACLLRPPPIGFASPPPGLPPPPGLSPPGGLPPPPPRRRRRFPMPIPNCTGGAEVVEGVSGLGLGLAWAQASAWLFLHRGLGVGQRLASPDCAAVRAGLSIAARAHAVSFRLAVGAEIGDRRRSNRRCGQGSRGRPAAGAGGDGLARAAGAVGRERRGTDTRRRWRRAISVAVARPAVGADRQGDARRRAAGSRSLRAGTPSLQRAHRR